ncbi:hypothetical protein LTR37_013931 [Vermiconidia calcicola]|uniref:Uncharacterized protein n=1 Tax=Vermiconidia calcicola TaxID=1690605 RepID=A0ACC3MWI7_9PEZI|nr:hypothetical protein LTR37_013931 [Vermiconidia calcicola]
MAQASAKALQSSLSKLQISQGPNATPRQKKAAPAESWEDEADSDGESSDTETETPSTPPLRTSSSAGPGPPPPTPSSPSFASPQLKHSSLYQTYPPYGLAGTLDGSKPITAADEARRPEKSTAVASRLIAAGIGQKAPKRTKEQREYDQAMKVQEKKKRDLAREEEERKKREVERAKRDVWGD